MTDAYENEEDEVGVEKNGGALQGRSEHRKGRNKKYK